MDLKEDGDSFDLDILHKKGAFPLLMVIASGDGTTVAEMQDLTELSMGTTLRRRDELLERNYLEQQPKLNDAGNAVIAHYTTERVAAVEPELSKLGEEIYRSN